MNENANKSSAPSRPKEGAFHGAGERLDPEYLLQQAQKYRALWEEAQKRPISPYSRLETGLREEKELVERRQQAIEQNDPATVMEIDQQIDQLRQNAPTAKPRPKRTPIGDRNVLRVEPRKGYHYRWVNDDQDRQRVQKFLDAGYGFVTEPVEIDADGEAGRPTQMGKRVCRSVGGGVKAYLMQIPQEFYEADQKRKSERVDESEEAIQATAKKVQGRYGEVVVTR